MSKVIAPFFFLVVAVGLFFTYIDPAYKQVQALSTLDARLDAALTRSKELESVRDSLLARYGAFNDEDLSKLRKLLPDTVDNVRLIIDIDNIASTYGMRVKNFSFPKTVDAKSADVETGPIGTAEIAFITSGTYADFNAFLRNLETSLRLLDVRAVAITAGGVADQPEGTHQFSVTLQTYWLR